MKYVIEREWDGFSSVRIDERDIASGGESSRCCNCRSTLIPGKTYLTWYTGGVWCDKCGPERIKESIATDIKVLDSLDVS